VATTAHRLGNGAGWKSSSDLMKTILNNVTIV